MSVHKAILREIEKFNKRHPMKVEQVSTKKPKRQPSKSEVQKELESLNRKLKKMMITDAEGQYNMVEKSWNQAIEICRGEVESRISKIKSHKLK